jgi:homospermidine synthase
VKQALLNVAADTGLDAGNPKTREEWAALSHKLGIKVIHSAATSTKRWPRSCSYP